MNNSKLTTEYNSNNMHSLLVCYNVYCFASDLQAIVKVKRTAATAYCR
jgi:hypothetical protein